MGKKKETPVDYVIGVFGTASGVARVLDIDRSAVTLWKKRGGNVPAHNWQPLIKAAKALGTTLEVDRLAG